MIAADQDRLNYTIALPEGMERVHPVFSVSKLRKYVANYAKFPTRIMPEKPDPVIDVVTGEALFTLDKILDKRLRRGKAEYLIQWKGYPANYNKWIGYFIGDSTWDEDLDLLIGYDPSVSRAAHEAASNAPMPEHPRIESASLLSTVVATKGGVRTAPGPEYPSGTQGLAHEASEPEDSGEMVKQ